MNSIGFGGCPMPMGMGMQPLCMGMPMTVNPQSVQPQLFGADEFSGSCMANGIMQGMCMPGGVPVDPMLTEQIRLVLDMLALCMSNQLGTSCCMGEMPYSPSYPPVFEGRSFPSCAPAVDTPSFNGFEKSPAISHFTPSPMVMPDYKNDLMANNCVMNKPAASVPLSGQGIKLSNSAGMKSVQMAKNYIGIRSQTLKGQMPHFTAAGGASNNCADFVSSILESTQGLKGHHVGVRDLESSLIKQGWKRVDAKDAKEGDVWISDNSGHTELVSQKGGKCLIGSNNGGKRYQTVTEDRYSGQHGGRFYTRA